MSREIEHETTTDRATIAAVLGSFADALADDGPVTLDIGEETVTVEPPNDIEFELEVEDEAEGEYIERSVEFELEWARGDDEPHLPRED
jgi:amphi-Trp domain-containing protein